MEVKFVKSSNNIKLCPDASIPEFAFIGRSNVGKSSLINMLTGEKGLAKTSSKPGKTKLINHFIADESWYIVDLPGYGYAKTSKTERTHFDELIKSYIATRKNLYCLFVLIDARHEPMRKDLDFLEFVGEVGAPFALIFTKTDKISGNQFQSNLSKFKKVMLESWEEMPPVFASSIVERSGKDEILAFIRKTFEASEGKQL